MNINENDSLDLQEIKNYIKEKELKRLSEEKND